MSGNVSNGKCSVRPLFAKKDVTNSVRIYGGEISHRWKESRRNYCKLNKFLPNISEADSTRICRMFAPLTKQTFVKCSKSEVLFYGNTTLQLLRYQKWKKNRGRIKWGSREVLVDCGKKTRVLSTKGDSVTKFPAV